MCEWYVHGHGMGRVHGVDRQAAGCVCMWHVRVVCAWAWYGACAWCGQAGSRVRVHVACASGMCMGMVWGVCMVWTGRQQGACACGMCEWYVHGHGMGRVHGVEMQAAGCVCMWHVRVVCAWAWYGACAWCGDAGSRVRVHVACASGMCMGMVWGVCMVWRCRQ